MNPAERASHPSRAQLETLLRFLQENPSLAKGFSRIPSARDTSRKMWEDLSIKLNSLGGCIKSYKQWMKYWADKKSAVKKKGALRFRTKNKTGGGAEVVELSDVEERILSLMGGESFAIGDRHLEINPFEDRQVTLEEGPSLHAMTQEQSDNQIECLPGTSYLSSQPSVVRLVINSPLPTQTMPSTPPIVESPTTREMSTTPSGSGTHPPRGSNVRRRLADVSQTHSQPNAATSSHRGRRRTNRPMSPPSQRQSRLTNVAERFLRLEERRINIEEQNMRLMQSYLGGQSERDRAIAEAMQCIGDGLKLLAEAIKQK